jgi:hypothetical protein
MSIGISLLGKKVKDRITGYEGKVTGYVSYLTGCNQALVHPGLDKDGKLQDPVWMDEQRLEVDETFATIVLDNSKSPGFDRAPPTRA